MKPVTVKQIFSDVNHINPNSTVISSMGEIITEMHRQVAQAHINKLRGYLPKNSLAFKILVDNNKDFYSEKQMWVIAYELEKNAEYCEQLGKEIAELEKKSNAKKEASKSKLQANKEATQDVLVFVKSNGRKLGDYYAFLKANKPFAKEFYSKKYTMDSAKAFLSN